MELFLPHGPLGGRVDAIASKSQLQRLLLCAALADRETVVHGVSDAADVQAMCRCLRALGAHIHAARRYAVVTGVRELHGASMTATDLRGGAAMVIGALCARGESELAGTAHLKRGYAELVPTLRACGADITER